MKIKCSSSILALRDPEEEDTTSWVTEPPPSVASVTSRGQHRRVRPTRPRPRYQVQVTNRDSNGISKL